MGRFDIDAFELLERLSQDSNVKLVDIARRITEMRTLDDVTPESS